MTIPESETDYCIGLRAQLTAANTRADQARDAALVEAANVCKYNSAEWHHPLKSHRLTKWSLNIGGHHVGHSYEAAILALRDKPAPAVTVDIDALAYRFWSIHPKDIPDPVGMPDGYKGGARAWMYATEIREAIRAITGGGDE